MTLGCFLACSFQLDWSHQAILNSPMIALTVRVRRHCQCHVTTVPRNWVELSRDPEARRNEHTGSGYSNLVYLFTSSHPRTRIIQILAREVVEGPRCGSVWSRYDDKPVSVSLSLPEFSLPNLLPMTVAAADIHTFNPSLFLGSFLLAILFNAYFSGAVGQQFYSYWTSGFRDSTRVRIFVVTQFALITFQSVILWQLAWMIFIDNFSLPIHINRCTWRSAVSTMCQCVLILSANVFLAIRIHMLTNSRLQSGVVMVFSCSAFILGMVTTVTTWKQALKSSFMVTQLFTGSQNATSVAWHGLQAVSELLITIFLTRALLKSRNGSQRPDNIVNCLIRSVIQIGFFGTIWALAGLTTWFFMRRAVIYEIFDLTVGSIYTHMIFDTLLSRVRLRERLAAESSPFEFVLSTQGRCRLTWTSAPH
ncbi:hypothetical protein BC826DRAFT_569172 [Russula brevipes]|nr:hypothetical protein BC826DRAFT_569172 [Russula brevipes]